ncbi:MAG TPA: winged helix-turn-helix domain-containing protein [Vicinamibacterales bacterium]|nr:winged helix-turn-helix domain-containing protein [Vicinamibacterales bacterium]
MRLTRRGAPVRLTGQPLQLLMLLVEEPGRIVTREEIRVRLWPDTTVEFDHSLDVALHRLRTALGDNARSPVFIESVPRVGYRFLGPVRTLRSRTPARWSPSARMTVYALVGVIAILFLLLVVSRRQYGEVIMRQPHASRAAPVH